MANILFERTAECLVVVRTPAPLSDAEWASYVAAIEQLTRDSAQPRALVVAFGGSPSPTQRRRLNEMLTPVRGTLRVAVLTGSTYVRGVASAITSDIPGYRTFDLDALEEATDYLGLRPSGSAKVKVILERLRREVG